MTTLFNYRGRYYKDLIKVIKSLDRLKEEFSSIMIVSDTYDMYNRRWFDMCQILELSDAYPCGFIAEVKEIRRTKLGDYQIVIANRSYETLLKVIGHDNH